MSTTATKPVKQEDDRGADAVSRRRITQLVVTADTRRQTTILYAVLDDGSIWQGVGEEDWEELLSVPGTARRVEQDASRGGA